MRGFVYGVMLAFVISACNSDSATSNTGGGGGLPVPKIDISVPAAVAIRQGNSASLAVTIIRTDYPGTVFVTVTGLPVGVTAPVISSTSTNAMQIPLQADTTAALGPATVTVNAQGIDVPSVTRSVVLTVSAR